MICCFFEILLRLFYPLYANYNTETWQYCRKLKQINENSIDFHEHIPNQKCKLYGVEIQTNSRGHRANKEFIIPKPDNVKRILVLGDSITLGWGVPFENCYPRLLELKLMKIFSCSFEVINTGVGNYNAKNELMALINNANLKPDLIVLGFYINDIERLQYPKPCVFSIQKNLFLYGFFMNRWLNIKFQGKRNYVNYYNNLYEQQDLKNDLKKNIRSMINFSEDHSIPFIFLNIPEFHNFIPYPFKEINEYLEKEILQDSTVFYINLLPDFINSRIMAKNLWVSYEDTHPNQKAHEIIAERLFHEIINQNIFKKAK